MPKIVQDATPPFIEVGYTDKVVFIQAHAPECLPAHDLAAESGELAPPSRVSRLPIREVIVWLRGEDSDV